MTQHDADASNKPQAIAHADIAWTAKEPADPASDCGGSDNGGAEQSASSFSSTTLHSRQFDDIYFSGDGPAETIHVFINGNDLPTRFAGMQQFAIGELGFGTGLNFLATLRAWREAPKGPSAHLTYFSIEKFPLGTDDLSKAHDLWPHYEADAAVLRRRLPPPARGFHYRHIADDVSLILYYGDVLDGLHAFDGAVDAWFLDGFSPAKNPDMWTPDLFTLAAMRSAPDASAATFTVAGAVRRGLEAAGFDLERRPGFGRKREMLTARLKRPISGSVAQLATSHTDRQKSAPVEKPWFAKPSRSVRRRSRSGKTPAVAIIGAGIAGACLARTLKNHGMAPVIFEAAGVAAGASGNRAGLIMPRLDLGDTAPAKFFVQSYLHTIDVLRQLDGDVFHSCGVTLKAASDAEADRLEKLAASGLLPKGWMEAREDGLFFPQAGVVDPGKFVAALIADTPLRRETATALDASIAPNGAPVLQTDKDRYENFDAIIIANSVDALRLSPAAALPLSGVAGQLDYFPDASAPQTAIAFGPYAAPAPGESGLVLGATYEKLAPGEKPAPTRQATKSTLSAVAEGAPDLVAALAPEESKPRVSVRCQTPDRLPVVGPVPDWEAYAEAYQGLKTGLKTAYPLAKYHDGLFMLTGLGSRGLVTAPLCAEIVASALTGAPSPVDATVRQALHPARFFIRTLKRSG